MAKQAKTGKSGEDIFKPEKTQVKTVTPYPVVPSLKGRPLEHKESWSKVTVVLLDNQIHYLDTLSATIRQNTKSSVSRAQLIRGILSAVEERGIDLSNAVSEDDIKTTILKHMS